MRVYVFVLSCVLGLATLASAQSLADVARKEGERRQDAKPASKTYTNTDLKGVRSANADGALADDANAAAGADANGAAANDDQNRQAADAAPDQDAAADKNGDRADASDNDAARDSDSGASTGNDVADAGSDANGGGSGKADTNSEQYWSDRMSQLRSQLERNETYLNALQSRVNALTADFVNRDDPAQRTQISNERQKALAELQRLEKQIQSDRKAIPELEEEARRAGVPSGWLR